MVSLNANAGPLPAGMGSLVLSRRREETIEIQDDRGNVIAAITVSEVRGEKVRLACKAPRNIVIHRQEIADAIRAGRTERHVPTK
jgi:carbon storage regulator